MNFPKSICDDNSDDNDNDDDDNDDGADDAKEKEEVVQPVWERDGWDWPDVLVRGRRDISAAWNGAPARTPIMLSLGEAVITQC